MIHYSCDRCKRVLDTDEDLRYVVKLEVYAALEPLDMDEVEDDRDHLLEIEEILERIDDADSECIGDDIYQKQHFDLCSDCYRKYIRNPIGRDLPVQFGFSQN